MWLDVAWFYPHTKRQREKLVFLINFIAICGILHEFVFKVKREVISPISPLLSFLLEVSGLPFVVWLRDAIEEWCHRVVFAFWWLFRFCSRLRRLHFGELFSLIGAFLGVTLFSTKVAFGRWLILLISDYIWFIFLLFSARRRLNCDPRRLC